MEEKTTKSKSEKRVKIKLPKLRGEKDQTVEVIAHGVLFRILRGVEVEVPIDVYDALVISERQKDETDDLINSLSGGSATPN